ncbi:7356_t:CDS:1 [Ambispora gerdemannii]|uniref:7356_t:CDS:1 n=1 Tax=Ambispora gerdemannii TaxID=144530 RepID=A0A9N9CH43_9GLOM|nr:7356_t:CDS:1 [Ambispora gerdemannii]
MTNKDQLQQELKEKVKEGIKPSHLKRSRSLGDIPTPPPAPPLPTNQELITCQAENKELKKKITKLADQILALRLSKIKEFGTYRENLKEVEQDLTQQIQTDRQEITKLEQRVQQLVKEKTRLSGEKSLAE